VKILLCLFLLSVGVLRAHDHVYVGLDPTNPQQLYLLSPSDQEALYVPRGARFTVPRFPGGCFACELSFTTGIDADPWIEITSVLGPSEGAFSFWEADALGPTWSRTTGWTLGQGTAPSFPVIYFGENHQHGRAFTMDTPGTYSMTFRAVDPNSGLAASQEKTIIFQALPPPQLSIRMENGQVVISFPSRLNFLYDLQVSTDLASGTWDSVVVDFIEGDGAVKETSLTLEHPRAFFRLVEF
jgi:hypothetical protein